MKKENNHSKYLDLRQRYPIFTFQSYSFQLINNTLEAEFVFNISNEFIFRPSIKIPKRPFLAFDELNVEVLNSLVFHIGMVELISYWKASCAPELCIKPHSLNSEQIDWWKKLYFNGLGEFFYLNEIDTSQDDFMKISFEGPQLGTLDIDFTEDAVIVPVGGGKDSVVSLELLKRNGQNVIPMMMNPREASIRTIENAGFKLEECLVVNRKLDKLLLELNDRGFLNGHTPFSALLAFVSILLATATKTPFIALSNESSANESTVPGSDINHQYSKSLEFESDFNRYVKSYIHPEIKYFSFLRPINELQIGKLFSGFPVHFESFRSCNVGSKTDSWCGKCPKCLFTYIILSPFIEKDILWKIFHKNLFEDESLIPVFDELTGIEEVKPFECVGTPDEVKSALWKFSEMLGPESWPFLIQYFKEKFKESYAEDFDVLIDQFHTEHYIPEKFVSILQQNIISSSASGFVNYLKKRIGDKSVLILGFGAEGQSTFRFFRNYFPDKEIGVADSNIDLSNSNLLNNLSEKSLNLGNEYLESIRDYDIIIKSPGVQIREELNRYDLEITSQSDLFLSYFRDNVIGVTGTKGKSTTASLIHHLLIENGKHSVLLGNIGVPAFDMVHEIDQDTVVVFELSAHQLEFVHVSPHVAVLLNIFPEHLDYFDKFENYSRAKENIFNYQEPQDFLITHESLQKLTNNSISQVSLVGESGNLSGCVIDEVIQLNNPPFKADIADLHLNLKGRHNLLNIVIALLAVSKFGVEPGDGAKSLKSFHPLPHRLEYVGKYRDIHFYNDSISTVPESTVAAIDTLYNIDTIILGGYNRQLDYSLLVDKLADSDIQNIIFLGKAGQSMMELISEKRESGKNLYKVMSLAEAVEISVRETTTGKLCVLSPAAASYDQFHNFEHRGDTFKQLVKSL